MQLRCCGRLFHNFEEPFTFYDGADCFIKACDASDPPENGGVGDCTDLLEDGASCQPICDTDYVVSGATTCDRGVLHAAVCYGQYLPL